MATSSEHLPGRPRTSGRPATESLRARRNGGGSDRDDLVRSLGWFSIGLGLAEILAPRILSRAIGVGPSPVLMRALGAREIASGAAVLSQREPGHWMWTRVAGDAMDLALLAGAMRNGTRSRARLTAAMLAVAGVTALDIWASAPLDETLQAVRKPVTVRKSIAIGASPEEIYSFWRNVENLPRVMRHLESVHDLDGRRSHWTAKAPAGMSVEWNSEITEDVPGERICWRAEPGSDIEHEGCVEFRAVPGRGATVTVTLTYGAPGGVAGAFAAKLFGEEPEQQVAGDLRRLKQVMETGEIATTEGQPTGRRSITGRIIGSASGRLQ